MAIKLQGYVFKDDGSAVSGATVQAYDSADDSTEGTAVTTNSAGLWTYADISTDGLYDIKISSGGSVRWRKGADKATFEELYIRNDTAATQSPLYVANATNNASVKVLDLSNKNSTRADGDEIYMSFNLNDSAGNPHEMARITAEAVDVTAGEEDGQIRFGVAVDGTMTDVFTINSSESAGTDMNIDVSGDLTLDADGGDIFFKDGGTTFGSATNNSGNLIIKSGTTTALTFTGSSVAIAGDLTITGDDLVMGTNTSGHVLVADGTNYNPVAVSGDVTIASNGAVTIANDAIDSQHYADGSIDNAHLADDAVDSDELAAGAVDTAHIADNQVTLAKMAGLARGKIIYGDASGDPAALAVGSANYVLTSDGTDISWAAATTGDITGVTAGNGLSGGGTSGGVTLALDLSELTDTAIANGDYIVFTDTTDSNATVKGDLADVATLFAGTGLTASNSVIGVDAAQTQITSVGTIGTGVWQGTVVAAAYLPDASTSAQGVSELATSAEVTTGTDTGRTVTPDALAGSVVFGTRYVQCVVFDFATDIAEGNGKFYFHIPAGLNGMDLVEVHSEVITAGNGSTIDVQIHNATDGSDMLSTSLTIDNTETGSDTAATAAVIDTGEDDVATNDLIRIDVDGNGGDTTIAKGLIVTLGFRIP